MEVKFTIRVNVDLERDIMEATCDPVAEGSELHVIIALAALCDATELPDDSRRIAARIISEGFADDDRIAEDKLGGDADV